MTEEQQLYRSDLLLYIDGVHIPCVGAIVRSGRFTIPEAAIDLVPHPQLAGMGRDDHVPVVLFEYDGQSPYGPMGTTSFRDDFPPFYEADPKFPVLGEWKYAFEGNIIGWEYAVTPEGVKVMRFNCLHDIGCLVTYLLKYAVGYDDAYKVIGQRTRSASRGEVRRLAKNWDLYYPISLFYKNGLPPAIKKKKKPKEEEKTRSAVLKDVLKNNEARGKTALIEGKSVAFLSMEIVGDEIFYELPDERIVLKRGSSAIVRRERKTRFKAENYADGQVATRQTRAGRRRSSAADYVNRPFDVLWNIFNACDKQHQEQFRSIIVGRYFWPRISRTRLLYRFLPAPLFEQPIDPTERTTKYVGVFDCIKAVGHRFKSGGALYTRLKAFEALLKQMAQMGGAGPAWAFYQTLFSQMLYDLLCIPNPALYEVEALSTYKHVIGEGDPNLENDNHVLANYTTIPTSFMGVPPRCNVIFPSEKIEFQYQENFQSQPTRVYVGDLFATKAGLIRHKGIPFTVGYPEEAFDHLRAGRVPGKAYLNNYAFLIYPEEYFCGPRTFTTGMPQWWHMMQDKVTGKKKTPRKDVVTTSSDAVTALQQAQSEDLLKTRNQTHAYKLEQWEKRKQQAITDAREKAAREGRDYVPGEEDFTEEAPKKAAVHKAVTRETVQNFVTGQVAPSGKKKVKKGVPYKLDMDPFFFAYARYIYYIERYGARVANISVSDNRNHVAGLPCLVLDREKPGMHFFGFIEKIQREFRQDGRGMQLQITYVRDMLEFVESLSELQDNKLRKRLGSAENKNPDEFWYVYDKHPGLVAFNEINKAFNTTTEWEDDQTFVEHMETGQPDPVPTVAFITAIPEHASEYYGRLLWGGTSYEEILLGVAPESNPRFSVPLDQIFKIVKVDRNDRELEDGVAFDPKQFENQAKYVGENAQTLPLTSEETHYRLKFLDHLRSEGFDPVARYDDAVKYTWRPICNLHQYVRFFAATWEAVLGAELFDNDFYSQFMESVTDPSKNVAASYPRYLYLHPYMFPANTAGVTSGDLSHIPPGPPVDIEENTERGRKKQTYGVPALDEVPHTRKAWQYILTFYRRTLLDLVPEEW